MQSRTSRDPLRDVRVAGQAFLIVNILPQRMARGTVPDSLQPGMRSGEFSRRYLCAGSGNTQDHKQQTGDTSDGLHVTTPTSNRTPQQPPHE
jgi:hypothetical protein